MKLMLSKLFGFSLLLSSLAIPVNAQTPKKDMTQNWQRGSIQWAKKKQYAAYKYIGKNSEFAVGFIYPNSFVQWDDRMPSIAFMDCKSFEMIGGWMVTDSTKENLIKDSTKQVEDANQFVKDFCNAHRRLFPEAAIYKGIEM